MVSPIVTNSKLLAQKPPVTNVMNFFLGYFFTDSALTVSCEKKKSYAKTFGLNSYLIVISI